MSGNVREYSMMSVAPTVCRIFGIRPPVRAKGEAIPEIAQDLAGSKRVAVLAPDALGLFAWNLWKQKMPFLSSLHEMRTLVLRSVMPSITPVNFATMVSGTDQAGHGIVTFRSEFACETIFDGLRERKMRSAGVGLSGYTGCELLGRFADICGDAGNGGDAEIAATALGIADREKPEFLIVQLGVVDDVFHEFGPSSPEVVPMLEGSDTRLKLMVERLKGLEYGVIILSDHGQHDVPDAKPGEHRGTHGTDRDIDCLVPCTWC
jgi:predicted AlkP superfamily pyrophosphatase or phosphodiesterase